MRVNDAIGMMVSIYCDWQDWLVNPRYTRKDSIITWKGYNPFRLGIPLTEKDFNDLVLGGQYTFQIGEDGALIQMYYEFSPSGDKVKEASLAYVGSPDSLGLSVDDLEEPTQSEEKDLGALLPWIRIDFQPSSGQGVLHGDCHLHISGFPNSRFLVRGLPTPKQFVELIMALFYPRIYESHRLNSDGTFNNMDKMQEINSPNLPFVHEEGFKHMTHFLVPCP